MGGLLSRLRGDDPERGRALADDEVLATALDLAFGVGLHAVTLAAVAERTGSTVDAVSRVEATDGALRIRVYRHVTEAELVDTRRSVLAHADVLDQLRTVIDWCIEPAGQEITATWLGGWALGRFDPALAAAVREEMRAWEVFLSSILKRGMDEGVFREADPDTVAAELIALVDSFNAYMLVGHGTELDRYRLVNAVLGRRLGVDLSGQPVADAASAAV